MEIGGFGHQRIDAGSASIGDHKTIELGVLHIDHRGHILDAGTNYRHSRLNDKRCPFLVKGLAENIRHEFHVFVKLGLCGQTSKKSAAHIDVIQLKTKFFLYLAGNLGNGPIDIQASGFGAGMQMQSGDSGIFLPKQLHNPGKFSIFIAEAEASALLRALGLPRAHTFYVEVHPDSHGSVFLRQFLQPVQFSLRVDVDDAAIPDCFQEGFLCFDGAIIDQLSLFCTNPLCEVVFLFGNHLSIASQMVKMLDNPGKRVGFIGIANDGIGPVGFQRLLQLRKMIIQLILMDDIVWCFHL